MWCTQEQLRLTHTQTLSLQAEATLMELRMAGQDLATHAAHAARPLEAATRVSVASQTQAHLLLTHDVGCQALPGFGHSPATHDVGCEAVADSRTAATHPLEHATALQPVGGGEQPLSSQGMEPAEQLLGSQEEAAEQLRAEVLTLRAEHAQISGELEALCDQVGWG